ncbi:hypothetical protein D9M70_623970 [compost metagenome]
MRFAVANTGRVLSGEDLEQRLNTEDRNDPRGFGLWICHEFAVRYGGGFAATEPDAISPPFGTSLSFWLPRQHHHDDPKTAAD